MWALSYHNLQRLYLSACHSTSCFFCMNIHSCCIVGMEKFDEGWRFHKRVHPRKVININYEERNKWLLANTQKGIMKLSYWSFTCVKMMILISWGIGRNRLISCEVGLVQKELVSFQHQILDQYHNHVRVKLVYATFDWIFEV